MRLWGSSLPAPPVCAELSAALLLEVAECPAAAAIRLMETAGAGAACNRHLVAQASSDPEQRDMQNAPPAASERVVQPPPVSSSRLAATGLGHCTLYDDR